MFAELVSMGAVLTQTNPFIVQNPPELLRLFILYDILLYYWSGGD